MIPQQYTRSFNLVSAWAELVGHVGSICPAGESLNPISDTNATCRLVKAGVIPQQYALSFKLVSAWAELVGHVGSICPAGEFLNPISDTNATCRLVKAGVIPQQYARSFNLVSAWAELVGYVGSIWLNALRIAAALEREQALSKELLRRKKVQHATCHDLCMSGHQGLLPHPDSLSACPLRDRFSESGACLMSWGTHPRRSCSFSTAPPMLITYPYAKFAWHRWASRGMMGTLELQKEVQALQEWRLLWMLAVIQDVSDSSLALLDNLTSRQKLHGAGGRAGL